MRRPHRPESAETVVPSPAIRSNGTVGDRALLDSSNKENVTSPSLIGSFHESARFQTQSWTGYRRPLSDVKNRSYTSTPLSHQVPLESNAQNVSRERSGPTPIPELTDLSQSHVQLSEEMDVGQQMSAGERGSQWDDSSDRFDLYFQAHPAPAGNALGESSRQHGYSCNRGESGQIFPRRNYSRAFSQVESVKVVEGGIRGASAGTAFTSLWVKEDRKGAPDPYDFDAEKEERDQCEAAKPVSRRFRSFRAIPGHSAQSNGNGASLNCSGTNGNQHASLNCSLTGSVGDESARTERRSLEETLPYYSGAAAEPTDGQHQIIYRPEPISKLVV